MSLTELSLKNLKPEEKRYLVRDDQGLYIEVAPTGRKFWKVRYMIGGQARKVSLGEYPYISLREARQKRDEMRGRVARGEEATEKPAETFRDVAGEWLATRMLPARSPGYVNRHKKEEKKATTPTFKDVAMDWFKVHIQGVCTEGHAETVISRLDRFLLPAFGEQEIANIKRLHILNQTRVA